MFRLAILYLILAWFCIHTQNITKNTQHHTHNITTTHTTTHTHTHKDSDVGTPFTHTETHTERTGAQLLNERPHLILRLKNPNLYTQIPPAYSFLMLTRVHTHTHVQTGMHLINHPCLSEEDCKYVCEYDYVCFCA